MNEQKSAIATVHFRIPRPLLAVGICTQSLLEHLPCVLIFTFTFNFTFNFNFNFNFEFGISTRSGFEKRTQACREVRWHLVFSTIPMHVPL